MTFYRIIFPLVLLSLMLMYLPSTCSLLRSADVHTLFCLLLCPFCILVMYPQYLPLTSTYPLLHSADVPTLVPSSWPPIHLDILSRFCRIFSNQAISKNWFRIIWPWLLSWLSQTVFVSMFWHDVDVVVFWVQWVICFVLWNDCGCPIMAVRVIQHDFINHG